MIQSELPLIRRDNDKDKIPAVYFRAEDSLRDEIQPKNEAAEKSKVEDDDGLQESKIDGIKERTGKLRLSKKKEEAADLRGGPGEGGVESYSGKGHEADSGENENRKFVRWSSSTEIGDFIRDAARGKEFAVEIEGSPQQIRVGVPSFNDRTFYLRQRLRRTSRKIVDMAAIKKECDVAAHRSAQRVAMAGFAGLAGWWFWVYYLTFQTDLGWDTMEPGEFGLEIIDDCWPAN